MLAQLTQERRHLTASPECAIKVAEIFRDVLAWHNDAAPRHPDKAMLRRSQLHFALMMWKRARNVFNMSWLATASESILREVLQQTYDLTDKDVADAWAELTSALVLAGPQDILHRLAVGDEAKQETELKRHLWSVLARCWTSAETKPDWRTSVSLVTLPIGYVTVGHKHPCFVLTRCARHFTLSDNDFALWQELLDVTISSARSAGDPTDRVLEHIAMHFHERTERYVRRQSSHWVDVLTLTRFSKHPRMAISFLSHLTMHDDRAIPINFLNAVNESLCTLYAAQQEDRYHILQSFHTLTTLLSTCAQHTIVSLVSAISGGLCIWVRDEEEVLQDTEYNDIVCSSLRVLTYISLSRHQIMPLYQTTLERLADYQFSADTLETIAPFLASAFKRMPLPALGPTAFKEFWDVVWPRAALHSSRLPEDFKQALRINHNVFGGHIPSDMSQVSQSQSQFESQEEVCHSFMLVRIE